MSNGCNIRALRQSDAQQFAEAFAAQGWTKPTELFLRYFSEQQQGKRKVFVAEVDGQPIGYVCLLPEAPAGPYMGSGFPCISDFNVLIPWQKKGYGGQLMDAAEGAAFQTHACVCLGVGMHPGYGSAQRLYVKRGYVPDGSGLWYQDALLPMHTPCCNDDDLVLYMKKKRPDSCTFA